MLDSDNAEFIATLRRLGARSIKDKETEMVQQLSPKVSQFFHDIMEILVCVDGISAGAACDLLIEMGYKDMVYIQQKSSGPCGGYKIEALADKLEDPDEDASEVKKLTFLGGPEGATWYTLSLQELLEDYIYRCCFEFGTSLTAMAVGVRVD